MPDHASGDDGATLPTEAGIESDDTLAHDPARPTPPQVSTGRVIRVSRQSLAPERLGRYAILRPLGRGGMGEVFEADDPELGRHVAIKVLRDDRDDPRFTEQLRREAQALAKLVHPNVVSVHDVGVDDGRVFLVMQLVDGETIDRWLRARHAGADEIVTAFRQAGQGLAAAHAAGLVHCDFKPGNVLVDKAGVVRVTDFGIARIGADEDGAIAGTPSYMAPEQFAGVATAASDQYAFCVALYEVLAGAPPFPESKITDPDAARARVVPAMPRTVRVPARIVRALERGLAADPKQRFEKMEDLLAALAPPVKPRVWVAAGALVLVASGFVAAIAMRPGHDAVRGPEVALPGVPDLSAMRALTAYGPSACAYAPTIDGAKVVFDRTEGEADDIYDLPLEGGPEHRITSAAPWEWRAHAGRHTGEVIHLVTDPKERTRPNVSYLDLATGRDTVAVELTAADAVATTAGIVYVPPGGEALRHNDGSHDQILFDVPKGYVFDQIAVSKSRDRVAAIAFDPSKGRLCMADLAPPKLTCFAAPAWQTRPAFGADDRFLYYFTADGIHRRELATGTDVLFLAEDAFGGLAVSDDGRALVYSDCGTHAQIVDWATSPPTVLTSDLTARTPQRAAGRLIWVRSVHGVPVVMLREPNGHERQLTDPSFGPVSEPVISPDGLRIAFQSGPPHAGVYVMTIDGLENLLSISDNANDGGPVWLGNQRLAYNRSPDPVHTTVYITRDDGNQLRVLPGSSRGALGGTAHRLLIASKAHFYWIDVETGRETPGPDPHIDDIDHTAVSPSGNWLLIHAGALTQRFYRIPLDHDGEPEQLAAPLETQTIAGATITDDGHLLVVPQTWSGDLHVVPAKPGTRF